MCGIAGTIGDAWTSVQFETLLKSIEHRGPDGTGTYHRGNVRLGMNRLKIRGETVPLPLIRENDTVAFNGQIYGLYGANGDYTDVLDGLESEVSILEKNDAEMINGMYACALTNLEGTELTLSTDYQFIKPLFYRVAQTGIAFCSEFVPLSRMSDQNTINHDALAELFMYGWYLSDQSYAAPLHLVSRRNLQTFKGRIVEREKPIPYKPVHSPDRLEHLRQRVRDSVQRCLVGTGPFGLALSGGLDSSILAWELNAAGVEDIVTISVILPDNDDGLKSLEDLKLPPGGAWTTWKHRTVNVDENWDFLDAFKAATLVFGHPTNMSSLPLFQLIANAASEEGVRVLMSGEGVDEFFGGYSSYSKVQKRQDITNYYKHPPRLKLVRLLFGDAAAQSTKDRFANLYADCEDLRFIERELRLVRLLLRTDVCLMSKSIEGRTPFLHNQIPDFALSIPWNDHVSGAHKALLREAYRTIIPNRSNTTKTRFKISDVVLRGYLNNETFRARLVLSTRSVFGEMNVKQCLDILNSDAGFDADICCLLMSLSFLIEEGIIE